MTRRFTVTWAQALLENYAEYWVASSANERRRLTAIANRIDRELSVTPHLLGRPIPLEPNLRVWEIPAIHPPTTVTFRVSVEDRTVTVLRLSITLA